MLRAVDSQSDRFEGLRNYILGNKRTPPEVPGARVKPRLANTPGGEIPDAPAVIPTSSQRPGKRTNDTVPYGRMVFTEFHDSPADPTDILPGDLVLVHKTSKSLGHDTNRASKVASWRQLNSFFNNKSSGVILGPHTSRTDIIEVRERAQRRLEEAIDDTTLLQERMLTNVDAKLKKLKGAKISLEDSIADLKQINTNEFDFKPEFDWQALRFVGDWVPDGILMSRDDDEHNSSFFQAGPGESGTMLNIAVQGPAAVRNSESDSSSMQVFDTSPMLMDDLYILLIAVPSLDTGGNIVHYSFQYKPTTGRILSELTDGKKGSSTRPRREYPSNGGLSLEALAATVHAWRIGRVMDVNAVKSPRRKITANVSILPLTLQDLEERFGEFTNLSGA
jgi:hypothetical protein